MRRLLACAWAMMAVVAPLPALGEESVASVSNTGAADAVSATLEVERTLLKEDLVRYDRIVAERAQSAARLADLYQSLDSAIRSASPPPSATLDDLVAQAEKSEQERAEWLGASRALLERIRDRMRRIDLLEDRLASLQVRASEAAGPMSGRWDVVLLPSNQRGTFALSQHGTLVGGTYSLEGGWTGSLQGTLVNRKVFLIRIDSKMGRSMELEGYLSGDGTQVRGTWLSYELSGKTGAAGQWSAVRRPQGAP